MNKFLSSAAAIALLAGAAGAARAADDSATINGITFYGTIDVGVTYETHGTPSSGVGSVGSTYLVQPIGNKSTWNASQSGMGQSRIGIKGAEDIGDGWTGLFKLETGINPMGGNITDGLKSLAVNNGLPNSQRSAGYDSSHAGETFERAAYVGLSNEKYGTFTAGRQTTLNADAIGTYDPLYNSYAFSLIGFSGTTAGSGSTEDARWDNSFKYLYSYGPVRIGAQYQFGGTITRNDTGVAADVGYDYAGLSVDAVFLHKKDEVNGATMSAAQVAAASTPGTSAYLPGFQIGNSIAGTISDDTSYLIAARYNWDKFKFYGAYEYIKSANPSSPLPLGTIDIGNYVLASVSNTAFTHNRVYQVAWTGVRYQATPKLELDGAFYYFNQNSYATGANTGCADTRAGNCSGDEYVYSFVADYHLSKKFDAYAGVMYSQVINGLASGFFHNNNMDPTVGIRYTF